MKFLDFIRIQNLILIILTQVFIRYGIFIPMGADLGLSDFQFILLVISSVSIAAGGNIINDIYDIEIDQINKPSKVYIGRYISEKSASNLFITLNIIGVGIGFYLSNIIGKPAFAAIFIIISASLYLYAFYLKKILLLGNLLISVLVGLSLIVVGIFDLLPVITAENQIIQASAFKWVSKFAFFAFFINFIREIVKDLLDINGDKKGNINSLPIILGRKRTVFIVFLLSLIFLFFVLYFMYRELYNQQIPILYFLITIVAPLLVFVVKSWDAEKNKEYQLLSNLLKIIMLFGIFAMVIFRFFMFNN